MAKSKESESNDDTAIKADDHVKKCGVIMPIADNVSLGYPPGHWRDVLYIIEEAFDGTEFRPNLVSKKDSIGLIHESIVTNIYSNEIVICDVSTKNPNVMFELGMRLAFDKPVIVIKDDKTDYSFDTGPIEHLNYPSSLRFQDIVQFKKELRERAIATYQAAKQPDFSPYLKNFNKAIVPGKIGEVQVTDIQYLLDKMEDISNEVSRISSTVTRENWNSENVSNTGGDKSKNKLSRHALIVALKIKNLLGSDLYSLGFEEAYHRVLRELPKSDIEMHGTEAIVDALNRLMDRNV